MKTIITLLALDKLSSDSFSRPVTVENSDQLCSAMQSFLEDVPFLKFYTDHQFESGDKTLFEKFCETSC